MKPFFFSSVLLTDTLTIVFKPIFRSVTHTSKLMMHSHDNILSLFCLSGEVFVDDCVLQIQKAERFN